MVGASAMDRIVLNPWKRVKSPILSWWLDLLTPSAGAETELTPSVSEAVGMTDAPRGALLHEAIVEDGLIRRYGIITPTMWNFSPLNMYTEHGPAETALIGTFIRDIDNPVEIGRIVRAFDPCLSCGTHLIQLRQQG